MQQEIIKLAPTLSGKERAKLIIVDAQKKLEGREVFSYAETKAMLQFDNKEAMREFEYYYNLYRLASIFFIADIEKAFLRFALSLSQVDFLTKAIFIDDILKIIIRELRKRRADKTLIDLLKSNEILHETNDPEKKVRIIELSENSMFLATDKQFIRGMEKSVKTLLEYRRATEEIEKELDGLPLFNEETCCRLKGYWQDAENSLKLYNASIEKLEEEKWEPGKPQPIFKDKEVLLANNFLPDEEKVKEIIAQIKNAVQSEMKEF